MRKIFFLLLLFSFLNNSSAFGQWQKPEIRLSNAYRYLFREHHGIYIKRGELEFSYDRGKDVFSKIKILPFVEFHNNLNKNRKLERKEVGLEVGVDLGPNIYLGESFQYTRYNYDWVNYIWHPRIKYAAEAETHVLFNLPLGNAEEDRKINVYFLDELTYNFKIGEVTRNEIAVGLKVPLVKHLQSNLGWRHIDRIHDFDSDALEITLTLVF